MGIVLLVLVIVLATACGYLLGRVRELTRTLRDEPRLAIPPGIEARWPAGRQNGTCHAVRGDTRPLSRPREIR